MDTVFVDDLARLASTATLLYRLTDEEPALTDRASRCRRAAGMLASLLLADGRLPAAFSLERECLRDRLTVSSPALPGPLRLPLDALDLAARCRVADALGRPDLKDEFLSAAF